MRTIGGLRDLCVASSLRALLPLLPLVLLVSACGSGAPQPYVWRVSAAGVGPIGIGNSGADLQGQIDQLGKLGECTYAKAFEAPSGLVIMLVDGAVARVDVIEPTIATDAGAKVGDTEARIRELYPSARTEPHKYTDGHYLVVDVAPGRRLVFETNGRTVTRYRAGVIPVVDWVEGCS